MFSRFSLLCARRASSASQTRLYLGSLGFVAADTHAKPDQQICMHTQFGIKAVKARPQSQPLCYAKDISIYKGVKHAVGYPPLSGFRSLCCSRQPDAEPSPGAGLEHEKDDTHMQSDFEDFLREWSQQHSPKQQEDRWRQHQKELVRRRQAELVRLAGELDSLKQHEAAVDQRLESPGADLKQLKILKQFAVDDKLYINNTILQLLAEELLHTAAQVILFMMGPEEDSNSSQSQPQSAPEPELKSFEDLLEGIKFPPEGRKMVIDGLDREIKAHPLLIFTDTADVKAAVQTTLAAVEPRLQEMLDEVDDGRLDTAIKVLRNADWFLDFGARVASKRRSQ